MTYLELNDGWSIGQYNLTDHVLSDVFHTGCMNGAVERPVIAKRRLGGVGTPSGELYCNRCSKKAPNEVVGMLNLCRWRHDDNET